MGVSTIGADGPFSTGGGTLIVFDRPEGFCPAHLLDPALPWVLAWRKLVAPPTPENALVVPRLFADRARPVRVALRSLIAVVVMDTCQAIELAAELVGGVMLQLDRAPDDDLPDDFDARPVHEQVNVARKFGVKLRIADRTDINATAFDDEALAGLRQRYIAAEQMAERAS